MAACSSWSTRASAVGRSPRGPRRSTVSEAWELAVVAGVAVVVLSVTGALAAAGSATLVGRVAEGIGADLRGRLVGRLLDQPTAFFRRHRSAELVNRITSDVRRVEDSVVAWWEVVVPESVVLVGTLVMLSRDRPLARGDRRRGRPVLVAVIVLRRRLVREAQGRAREQEGRLGERAQDLVRNVRVVQAFGHQRAIHADFDRLSQRVRRTNAAAVGVEARLGPLADVVLGLGGAAVLVLGVVRVQQGAMTTGTLLVALTYVAGIYVPLRSLTSLAATLARAEASRNRLDEILAARTVRPTDGLPVRDLRGDVVLESVSFGYDTTPVLVDVDLVFASGRVTALTGPTGAGKSTVLNLLLRFEQPTSGLVCVGGRDLRMLAVGSCADTSPTSRRSPGSSTTRSGATSRSATPPHRTRRSVPRPRARSSAPSPSGCRRASTPPSASPASSSRAGSASGWRSRGPSYAGRTCSCWTSRPPASTTRRPTSSSPLSRRPRVAAPSSS